MTKKLMIVDDFKPLHDLLRIRLGEDDYAFESAYTGSVAVDLTARSHPDLVLLDVDLPDMNGYDVCRFLKFNPVTSQIPIIFLTASGSLDEKICGLELSAADYITKPFDYEDLSDRVRMALGMN